MQTILKRSLPAICLAIAVAGLAGCNTSGRSTGTYIDDRMVSSRVRGALNDAPVYKFPDVNVSSFNGTVQLNGFVATQGQKEEAANIASRVQGVRQLVNNITLKPLSPTGRDDGAPVYYPPQTTTPQ